MYYSFKCTYCGRLFYTYYDNKEEASHVLYRAIKQHLIDYNEDHKEYQLDDGEEIDSDEIYYSMSESKEVPAGGYEAVDSQSIGGGGSAGSETGISNVLFYIILAIIVIVLVILFIFGGIHLILP